MIKYQYTISLEPSLLTLELNINNSSNISDNIQYSVWHQDYNNLELYFNNSLSSSEQIELSNIIGQL